MLKQNLFYIVGIIIAIAFVAVISTLSRPLLPVDETRYATVAWEMFEKNEWILPTLNFEPYHHKPPLLFWLIMGFWSLFGATQSIIMLVPAFIFMGLIASVYYLARSLFPHDTLAPGWLMLLTVGCFPLLLYSNIIMFDLLLSIFVIVGMASIWNFAHTAKKKHLIFFALCVGLGTLAKGPVILLNLLFPVLLRPLWQDKLDRQTTTATWSIGFFIAVIAGALIALAWAIPAAIKGGPEFTNKIFWGQTAGRVGNSFDHARPFWWYLPLLPLMLCPWICMPSLWSKLKNWRETSSTLPTTATKFLLCWIIPVFVSFSFISGKQIHYLFPILIGCLALIGMVLFNGNDKPKKSDLWSAGSVIAVFILLPAILKFFALELAAIFNRHLLDDVLLSMSATLSLGAGALFLFVLFIAAKQNKRIHHITALTFGMVIFMVVFHLEAKNGFYKNYDLRPMAEIIANHKDRPMAFLRNYHGEWGFLAKIERPVTQIEPESLPSWFAQNPNGIAFIRTSREEEFRGLYDVIFEMPYKMNNTYAILVPKGQGQFFVRPQQ